MDEKETAAAAAGLRMITSAETIAPRSIVIITVLSPIATASHCCVTIGHQTLAIVVKVWSGLVMVVGV